MATRKRLSMPRKESRQRRSRQTVEAILQAAAQVFGEGSYDSGTTDRIAERAGVSVGTLYQYFPDKDAILTVLFDQHVQRVLSFLGSLVEEVRSASLPVAEAVRRIVRAVAEQQETGGGVHRAVAEVGAVPAAVAERGRAFHRQLLEQVRSLMEASREITVNDLDGASYLVVSVVDAAIHGYVADPPGKVTREAFLSHVTHMVVAYLTARVEG